jgi:hypothetical protein
MFFYIRDGKFKGFEPNCSKHSANLGPGPNGRSGPFSYTLTRRFRSKYADLYLSTSSNTEKIQLPYYRQHIKYSMYTCTRFFNFWFKGDGPSWFRGGLRPWLPRPPLNPGMPQFNVLFLPRVSFWCDTVLPGYNAVVYTADSDIPRVFPVPRFF